MKERKEIYLHETDLFKNWLKSKGYVWPEKPIAQENLIAEFLKEGLEREKETYCDYNLG